MKKLKTKILLRSISVTALFLVILTIFFQTVTYRNTLGILEKTLKEATRISAHQVEAKLNTLKSLAAEWGMLIRLSDTSLSKEEKKTLLNEKRDNYGFKEVALADVNGATLTGENIKDKEFFKAALSGNVYVSDPIVAADAKSSEFYVSAPLWREGKKGTSIVGVVYIVLDNDYLYNIIADIKVGNTGTAYIVDKNSTVIAHLSKELVFTKYNPVEEAKSDSSLNNLANLLLQAQKKQTVFDSYTFKGESKFAMVTPINDTNDWAIAIAVLQNEYMQSTIISGVVGVIFTILAIATVVLLLVQLSNNIVKPVLQLSDASKKLENGDLNINITHHGNDELGALASSFRHTISSLDSYIKDIARICKEISQGNFDVEPSANFKGSFVEIANSLHDIVNGLSMTMQQIANASEQVNAGANQVSTGAESLAQGAAEQAASTEELSATIQEIQQKIHENAENADEATNKANAANEKISISNDYMIEMKNAMDDINVRSAEISKIIKTIDDIAFQTNILALNAAVEAARAGTAGKGFAVVADEVRNLATKSQNAAKDITSLIEGTITAIEKGSDITNKAADALKESVEATNEAVTLINKIKVASAEEADAVTQITLGVDLISEITQSNSALAQESAASSEELAGQATELSKLLSNFNLNHNV